MHACDLVDLIEILSHGASYGASSTYRDTFICMAEWRFEGGTAIINATRKI